MFIWTINGTKLVKTEDIKIICLEKVENDVGLFGLEGEPLASSRRSSERSAWEMQPVSQTEFYVLRAYYVFKNRRYSVVLACYENIDIAKERFAQLIYAIGQGATVFSLCEDELLSDDGKSEPEEVLEMEP